MSNDSQFVELSSGLAKLQIDLEKSLKQVVSKSELQEAIQSSQDAVILKMQQLLAPPLTNVEKPPTTQHLDGSHESRKNDGHLGHNFSGFGSSHQDGNPSSNGFHTKSIRLEFPKFYGSEPVEWCYRATQFFDHYNTPNIQRLAIASFHMEGKALI
jgi:hypothetical protein